MSKEERLAKSKSKAELELLLHDENEKVTHFNAKDIIKSEKSKSKKQKKKLLKANLEDRDILITGKELLIQSQLATNTDFDKEFGQLLFRHFETGRSVHSQHPQRSR